MANFKSDIKNKLLEIDEINKENLYYGTKPSSEATDDWSFFVFGRANLIIKKNPSLSINSVYFVDIIQENFIDENLLFKIISKLEELPGLRVNEESCPNEYVYKSKTQVVCEMTRLTFTKPVRYQDATSQD